MTDNIQAEPTLLASLRFESGNGTVRAEDSFATDIDDLWSALIDPARLARWVATVTGDLRLGGSFQATFTSGWIGSGRVEVCEAPHRLMVTLDAGEGNEEPMTLEARLTVEGTMTRLVIEDSGFARDELAGHGAGWQAHIEDLGRYLSGQAPSDWAARWRQLTPAYERLAEVVE